MSHAVLLYYQFVEIDDPEAFAKDHLRLCKDLGLVGRVLIASEGLNGTVSGTNAACDAYIEAVHADPRFASMVFKRDPATEPALKKLFVRARSEIIVLGKDLERPVHEKTGPTLTPKEFRAALDEENVVIIDGRNKYESDLGYFRGALRPPIENFRDLPEWILKHRDEWRGKKILTYCTGGIRCEKLTAWMEQEGIAPAYQLEGGIVAYGQDPEVQGEGFEGLNVVFDDRIAVAPGPKCELVTTCRECGAQTGNYVNCANVFCNDRLLMCPACVEKTERCCSEACRVTTQTVSLNVKGR